MMMILVSAESYLMTFVGWEGVGLCSYLLIGFWFEKGKDGTGNAIAAKKAFLTNRVGDFGFLAAMFLIFITFKSLNFTDVMESAASQQAGSLLFLGINLFLLLAVTGKSAQIPLFVWLPDAMAGPTPVSALIHAATMVTAGVYLVARSAPLFALHPAAQQVVAHGRRSDCLIRCHNCSGTERYQESSGILYHQPTGFHGSRGWDGRLCGRDVPPGHSRFFQSLIVPLLRSSDSRCGIWSPSRPT